MSLAAETATMISLSEIIGLSAERTNLQRLDACQGRQRTPVTHAGHLPEGNAALRVGKVAQTTGVPVLYQSGLW